MENFVNYHAVDIDWQWSGFKETVQEEDENIKTNNSDGLWWKSLSSVNHLGGGEEKALNQAIHKIIRLVIYYLMAFFVGEPLSHTIWSNVHECKWAFWKSQLENIY